MQFPGWWVDGDKKGVKIVPQIFDETELSEASDWREADQNEDPDVPHGYVDWDAAIADARRRLGLD